MLGVGMLAIVYSFYHLACRYAVAVYFDIHIIFVTVGLYFCVAVDHKSAEIEVVVRTGRSLEYGNSMLAVLKSVNYRNVYGSIGMVQVKLVLDTVYYHADPRYFIYEVWKNHHSDRCSCEFCAHHTSRIDEQGAVRL